MKSEELFGCPVQDCDFTGTYDAVADHLFEDHENEIFANTRPINLGEMDTEAGQIYEKIFKKKKTEETEYKITPKSDPATLKRLEEMQMQITRLQEQNKQLKNDIGNIAYQHAQDRQKMAVMQNYLNNKKNGTRRDFEWFANELLKHMIDKILKHKRHTSASMDYKEVKLCLRFKHDAEAYRIMRDVVPLKHGDKVKFVDRGKKTRPRYLLVPKKSFADAVRDMGGYSPSLLGEAIF